MSEWPTPIITVLNEWMNKDHAPFYTPGHKGGVGIDRRLKELLGERVFKGDLAELPGLDNLHGAEGIIAQSQELSAQVFGADQTWFLINGTTGGLMAGIMAVCNDRSKIVVPRNCHRSIIGGITHSGAIPIYLNPEYSPPWDIAHGITPESVKMALQRHSGIKAIVVVYPTYYGVGGDLKSIVDIAHDYHVPVIVDEAHGAHFGFHCDLPPSSLSCGADLVVQSTHKVLGAMTQASMLHVQGDLIDRDRLGQCLQLFQSTSPNYLMLASLDSVQYQMAVNGLDLMDHTLGLARFAREEIGKIHGLSVLTRQMDGNTGGFQYLDETRLTVNVSGLGMTGYEADEILNDDLGIVAELPSLRNLTFIISLGNRREDILRLIGGLHKLARDYPHHRQDLPLIDSLPTLLNEVPSISPRKAFQSRKELVTLTNALNQISGETICPYPPGIPIIIAGEMITEGVIVYLQQLKNQGAKFTGNTDPTLESIQIIATS
jgi:arginine/lysine/ornithine decarboxylase